MTDFIGKAAPLSEGGFNKVNAELGGNACTLWALMTVETRGFGFLPDRRPKILYERHVFHRLTDGRFDRSEPAISSASAGGYLGGAAEYGRLEQAMHVDRKAALESVSWGMGQIMGFNASGLGYADAADMVAQFIDSEDNQLDGVRSFIAHNPKLDAAFRERNWQTVALCYNGAAIAKNQYDRKLADFFNEYTANGTPSIGVRAAQARLTYLGFDPHGIDGMIGANTRKALAAFQKSRGIPVTSELDSRTESELAIAADT